MKKKLFLPLLSLPLCVAFTACSSPQSTEGNTTFDPWDNLGGGGTSADATSPSDTNEETYSPDSVIEIDESLTTTTTDGSNVNLSDLTSLPDGVAFAGSTLTISKSGTYVLSGTLSGNVVVKDTDGTDADGEVRIVLNNANITTTSTQTVAALVFQKTSYTRILTVADGTTNTLSDSVGDTEADGDSAAVQAKKCSLTINGSGTLNLNAVGEDATGLKVKKELNIIGTTINITAKNNGIKADEKIVLIDATINATVDNDGIKTDMEPSTTDEAAEYAADATAGYIYIQNTDITLTTGDDGISANNSLYIANTSENTITVTTNGGTPSKITETSSDNADGKAIRTAGITYTDADGNETDYAATYENNYSLVITGGKFEINSNDDAIASKGNLVISGGELNISSGDDGIHAEYLTKITGGEIVITNSYEGVEGAAVEITGGSVSVTSTDDGINAANSDLRNYSYYIHISGGEVLVNALGDGIDSNGSITLAGGTTIVYGPSSGDNTALDSDGGIVITGGTVFAIGTTGMVENPSSTSTQPYISINLTSSKAANSQIAVYNSASELIQSVTAVRAFSSVIISMPSFSIGNSYTVELGTTAYTSTLSSIGTAFGSNAGGMGNQGINNGWRPR